MTDTRQPRQNYLSVEFCDVNRDGAPDLVLGAKTDRDPTRVHDRLLLNDGEGRFADAPAGSLPPPAFDPSVYFTLDIRCGDLNLDGWNDLLVNSSSGYDQQGNLAYWRNNRNGTFRDVSRRLPRGLWPRRYVPNRIRIADLNGDVWPDLLVGGGAGFDHGGHVLINRGNGAFRDMPGVIPSPKLDPEGVHMDPLDADGDGDTDILLFRDFYAPGDGSRPRRVRPSILFNQLNP